MISPIATDDEYLALVCHQCGTIISLVPGNSQNQVPNNIEKKVEILQNSVDQLNNSIGKITVGLKNLLARIGKNL